VDDPVNGISVHGAGGLLGKHHSVHTEWQWLISGVHSIMMEKSAPAGESGAGSQAHRLSLYLPSSTKLHAVYAPAESAYTVHSPYFISTTYVLCGEHTSHQNFLQFLKSLFLIFQMYMVNYQVA
jgi:hypothetical protein